MRDLIKYIFQNRVDLFKNLIILITSTTIFLSTIVVDHSDTVSGRGFEYAKVTTIQIGSIILIGLTISFLILNTLADFIQFKRPAIFKLENYNYSLIVFLLFVLAMVVATLISPFADIALNGNTFRYQGLNTYLPIIVSAFIILKSVNFKNWHLLSLAIITSAVVNSVEAYSQFYKLASNDPGMIREGIWVNGFYGQANFFSTHIITAIILTAYYLTVRIVKIKLTALKLIVPCLAFLTLLLLISIAIFSYSEWGWVALGIAIFLIITYELLPKKLYLVFFIILLVLFFPIAGVIYLFLPRYELRFEIWQKIRDIMIYQNFIDINDAKYTFFGFGFDTLGQLFQNKRIIPNLLIDRAHNIFFDILIQLGVIGFGFFSIIYAKIFRNLKKIVENRVLFFLFLAGLIWMFKSLINEYSIANLYQWVILIGGLIGLMELKEESSHHQAH